MWVAKKEIYMIYIAGTLLDNLFSWMHLSSSYDSKEWHLNRKVDAMLILNMHHVKCKLLCLSITDSRSFLWLCNWSFAIEFCTVLWWSIMHQSAVRLIHIYFSIRIKALPIILSVIKHACKYRICRIYFWSYILNNS